METTTFQTFEKRHSTTWINSIVSPPDNFNDLEDDTYKEHQNKDAKKSDSDSGQLIRQPGKQQAKQFQHEISLLNKQFQKTNHAENDKGQIEDLANHDGEGQPEALQQEKEISNFYR